MSIARRVKNQQAAKPLRSILLELAKRMQIAIADYHIIGLKGFKRAYAELIGTLQLESKEIAKTDLSVRRPLFELLVKSTKVIEVASNIANLLTYSGIEVSAFLANTPMP